MLDLHFAKHLRPSPTILGLRFLSLEDTTFEEDFSTAFKTSPTILGAAWHGRFYEELLVGLHDYTQHTGQAKTYFWGERRNRALLRIRGDGFKSGPIGMAQSLPVCILLEVPSSLPEALLADCKLSCRVIDLLRRDTSGGYVATTSKQSIPNVRLASGPALAICSGDPAYYWRADLREHALRIKAPASGGFCRRIRNMKVRFPSSMRDPSSSANHANDQNFRTSIPLTPPADASAIGGADFSIGRAETAENLHTPQLAHGPSVSILTLGQSIVPASRSANLHKRSTVSPSGWPTPLPAAYHLPSLDDVCETARTAVAAFHQVPCGETCGKSGPIRLYHNMRTHWTSDDLDRYGATWDGVATYLDLLYGLDGPNVGGSTRPIDSSVAHGFKKASLQRHGPESRPSKILKPGKNASKGNDLSSTNSSPRTIFSRSVPTLPTEPHGTLRNSDTAEDIKADKGKRVAVKQRSSMPGLSRISKSAEDTSGQEVLAPEVRCDHKDPGFVLSSKSLFLEVPPTGPETEAKAKMFVDVASMPSHSSQSLDPRALSDRSWSMTSARFR
ncbi:hypothetical protein P389DRAFT_172135 [Cystobasidium minutum MCA 4210]|uniref:uncharacterized protein n=1 Tax=Cystobasidium minutum MCA 4210 TaxID=1397322 RepID=UPI0034CFAD2B|eukprot:jgi/Rhomi1/172135/fgenesh1_kg.4_\